MLQLAAILVAAKTFSYHGQQKAAVGVKVSRMMRMVRVHVEDHAAWSEGQMGRELDRKSENGINREVMWDFR